MYRNGFQVRNKGGRNRKLGHQSEFSDMSPVSGDSRFRTEAPTGLFFFKSLKVCLNSWHLSKDGLLKRTWKSLISLCLVLMRGSKAQRNCNGRGGTTCRTQSSTMEGPESTPFPNPIGCNMAGGAPTRLKGFVVFALRLCQTLGLELLLLDQTD